MKKLLKANNKLPIGVDIIRIVSGGIIVSFGFEVFNAEQMAGYMDWLTNVGMPLPGPMAYIGKLSELIFGCCLLIGLFTRISTVPLMITMCVINFIMLEGDLRTQPFYLLLLFGSFFFLGSGRISIDFLRDKKKSGTAQ